VAKPELDKKLEILTTFIEYTCTILFVVMTLITFLQVVGRYVFGVSYFWAEELARFTMIWIVFLGASVSVGLKAHTRIDFFINLLSPKVRKYIEIFNSLACLAFILFVSYNSIDIIRITTRNLSTGLRIPLALIYIALPVSGILMTVYFLAQIYFLLKTIPNKEGEASD